MEDSFQAHIKQCCCYVAESDSYLQMKLHSQDIGYHREIKLTSIAKTIDMQKSKFTSIKKQPQIISDDLEIILMHKL